MSASEGNALDHFPSMLVELVRANAKDSEIEAEGFSKFEASAVRALVTRERTEGTFALSSSRRRRAAVTVPRGT